MSTSSSVPRKKIQTRTSKQSKLKQFPLLNLYIIVITIVEVIGEMANIFILKMLKPIPMILMIIYISGKNSNRNHLVPTLIRAGLILSLVGDLFLMLSEISAFMIGTCFFLVAHILYCIAYSIGSPVRQASSLNKIIRFIVSLLMFGMFMGNVYTLWNVMPNRLLFTTYGFILCLMNIFSIKRYRITTPYSFGFTVAGSILFGLSDNLLASLKFNGIQSSFGRGMVMLFYYSGQYLLMHGAMHHSNLQHQINKFIKNTGSNTLPVLAIGKNNTKFGIRRGGSGEQLYFPTDKNTTQ